jgi:hypothetical protein
MIPFTNKINDLSYLQFEEIISKIVSKQLKRKHVLLHFGVESRGVIDRGIFSYKKKRTLRKSSRPSCLNDKEVAQLHKVLSKRFREGSFPTMFEVKKMVLFNFIFHITF